jgi:hypothetical protein
MLSRLLILLPAQTFEHICVVDAFSPVLTLSHSLYVERGPRGIQADRARACFFFEKAARVGWPTGLADSYYWAEQIFLACKDGWSLNGRRLTLMTAKSL